MKLKIIILLTMLLLGANLSWAQSGVKDYRNFKAIPILDQGRLKPLDTYARNLLVQFSGKDTYERKDAIVWLSQLLFTPLETKDHKILLINNPDIAIALDIPPETHRRYSFAQIQKVYPKLLSLQQEAKQIPEKERDLVQNEILRVFENVRLYAQLSHELIFTQPHADFTIHSKDTKKILDLPQEQDQFSFIDIALRANQIREATQGLEHKSNVGFSRDEAEIMEVVANLFQWSKNYRDFHLDVIPSKKGWISPWDTLGTDFSSEQNRELLIGWQKMALYYVQDKSLEFDMAAKKYVSAVQEDLKKDDQRHVKKFSLELIYHSSRPFFWSKVFYILAFIFFVISFVSSKSQWYWLGLFSIVLGFVPHTLGLIARIIIMERPPVTSLYETFIFVSFITVFLGLAIEHFNRQWLGIVVAAIGGASLLFVAGKYSAEGDTLKMLVAVLNSNFWLGTHVITITMGYGATCVAGILGHIWLVQAAFKKDSAILDKSYKTILGILGLALALTFLGTNLGGIWADQSWGRFWGWDPKENGALMIVIWTALLFHAKIAKLIGPLGLAVGAVIGMIVVMWAWFGVNLLSVGLHSYGFTSGIAASLLVYLICEIIFLVISSWACLRK